MLARLFLKIDKKINRLLDFEGCDQKTLNIRKSMWIATVYGWLHCFILTIIFIVVAPQLTILIYYGYFMVIYLLAFFILITYIKYDYTKYYFVHLIIMLLVTSFTIFKLGGLTSSAGLIMASFSFVLVSIPLQNKKIVFTLFSLYFLIVLITGILSPWLVVPKQITPNLNSLIFMINTLSMSGFAFYLLIYFINVQKEFDEMEANKLKEINDTKTKLFTGITHEFRTPLTIIKGMSNLIENNPTEWTKEGTSKIKENSNILLNLVNQMLDLAKIETGVMPLHIIQSDIIIHLGYIIELFKSSAHSKNIHLQYDHSSQSLIMDFDPDKLLHILSNLLANALKYTPEGGQVTISTESVQKRALFIIKIRDNGIGIDEEHLPYIFDRFYQVEHDSFNDKGTGLGLALAKELIELIDGSIYVKSKIGKGTTFTIQLPISNRGEIKQDFNLEKIKSQVVLPVFHNETEEALKSWVNHSHKLHPTLLIVEDSHDVALYLSTILKESYNIEKAENGKIGVEMALKTIPDIILSDVMMPKLDGIALLNTLKNDIRTSHIPIILLTAKADVSSRIEGIEHGADAYLAKPFEEKELQAVLKNLVESRKRLHERYSSPDSLPKHPEPEFKLEDTFMLNVTKVLESNYENEEFGISQLCYELAVSRTQLYRKFKSVSNKTLSEYFKHIRLHKAKELLMYPNMNITEIAYATGFKSLSYFSREFNSLFGKSPLEFRKN